MSTNAELIADAFRMIGVLAEGIPLSSEQASEGLRMMNEMLADWDADSIDVGHIPQSNPSEESPIYSDAVRAVKFNLAMEIANGYGVDPPSWIVRIADQALARLVRDSVNSNVKEADMTHMPGVLNDWDIYSG